MGLLDNNGSNGNLSKGLIAVLGALLAGKLISDRIDQPEAGQADRTPEPRHAPHTGTSDRGIPGGGQSGGSLGGGGLGDVLSGGLGGLLDKLRGAGHGSVADSWVQPGENKEIAPKDLGTAIGQKTLSQLATEAGMSEEELLQQLSKVLPGMVDKLTPDGRIPDNAEIQKNMWKNPW